MTSPATGTSQPLSVRVANLAEWLKLDRIRDSSIGAQLYGRVYWIYKSRIEARGAAVLMQYVPPGSTVIDVGANLGYFTRLFVERSLCGNVLAVEPEARNLNALRQGAGLWGRGRVEIIEAAVADVTGTVHLHVDRRNHSDHQLAADGVPVRALRLDDLVAEHGVRRVGMIKIDVQGAEARVLQGGRDVLAQHRPAIFIELDPERLAKQGATPTVVLDLLADAGYAFSLLGPTAAEPCSRGNVIEELAAHGYLDVLCRPVEQPDSQLAG
jgi:FkbM family methyltransferase